jgi:hypothetical protein
MGKTAQRVLGVCALGGALVGMGLTVDQAAAQGECHPAYGGCLPIVYDLDCAEIGWAVVQVYDPYNDPYGLDVLYGAGNGWTCDGVG